MAMLEAVAHYKCYDPQVKPVRIY